MSIFSVVASKFFIAGTSKGSAVLCLYFKPGSEEFLEALQKLPKAYTAFESFI